MVPTSRGVLRIPHHTCLPELFCTVAGLSAECNQNEYIDTQLSATPERIPSENENRRSARHVSSRSSSARDRAPGRRLRATRLTGR